MKYVALIVALTVSAAAFSDERILSFHSDVRIFADGVIEVTETIKVQSEGQQIRRGIYRDFPVEYEDTLGNTHEVSVEPVSLHRNDLPETFHTIRNSRDVRTYFGRSDRLLDPGIHTYAFRYRANRMLGFFDQHDELYWNATGNRWGFVIDQASATIRLDFEVARNDIHIDAYTGRLGSKAQNYDPRMDEAGNIHFVANSALPPSHGLTVVVGWPKGHVAAPTELQRLQWLISDNRNLMVAAVGFLLLLAYYVPVWRARGRDFDAGVIVTRYQPPNGFSPASLRYIRQMYYDDKTMTAGVVSLAVKGYLQIKFERGTHTLIKLDADIGRPDLATGEQDLFDELFRFETTIALEQRNHQVLGRAKSSHAASLKKDYKENYFRTNGLLNIPAIIIVLATTAIALNVGKGPTAVLIGLLIAMFVTTVFFIIIMKRPTLRGRALLDEMLGFKDYLEVAERDDLNSRNPRERTPQLFEEFLPFALALGVDQEWSEKFADVLASIREPNGSSYSPSWYNGKWSSSNLSGSTSGIVSGLNSSISSAATPPGSSSGGGGGGSSGGGGGGGGGGGW